MICAPSTLLFIFPFSLCADLILSPINSSFLSSMCDDLLSLDFAIYSSFLVNLPQCHLKNAGRLSTLQLGLFLEQQASAHVTPICFQCFTGDLLSVENDVFAFLFVMLHCGFGFQIPDWSLMYILSLSAKRIFKVQKPTFNLTVHFSVLSLGADRNIDEFSSSKLKQ